MSEIIRFLKCIKPIADNQNATLAQLVIKWTLKQPGITCVLAGARNETQVLENLKAWGVVINKGDAKKIAFHLDQLKLEVEC